MSIPASSGVPDAVDEAVAWYLREYPADASAMGSDDPAHTHTLGDFSAAGHERRAAGAAAQLAYTSTNFSCASGTANVGTGGTFKVPSLVGVGARAPFLHDGCAATLMDRFTTCGGGDLHGKTSQLTPAQLSDLVAYLETL